MSGAVQAARAGDVLHLVLSAPERRNALSRAMLSALTAALTDLDAAVTGVVISGSGQAFSAGADFAELSGTSADTAYDDAVAAVTAAIVASPRVVVAAIEGPCVGAAADLALSCDLRVAGEGSYLQVPAARLGLLYNPSALERIARCYPRDAVRRLLLLGERFSEQEALKAALVSYVVPRGDAAERAIDLLGAITPGELGAIAATKGFLNDRESGQHRPGLWQERRRRLLDSPARKAAVDAAKRRHLDKERQRTP